MKWWPFKRQPVEKRSAASGFTAEIMAARQSYIAGRSGIADLTATAQSCISLWESGFAIADVRGTRFLTRHMMAMAARSLALRGEFVALVRGDGLVPASDWDLRTRNGRPTAYRLSIGEASGSSTTTALAAEVVHVRLGADPVTPWLGSAPLRRARLTAGLLEAVESALAEVFEQAPIGSSIIPFPESPDVDLQTMGREFRGRRGRVLLRESVAVSAAGGPAPASDWKPQDTTPNLQAAMPAEMLAAARDAICTVFGVLPSWFAATGQGPAIREGQRHLAAWVLQPIAELLAEEATEKLGSAVAIDLLTPLQAFDQGGSARAVATLVQAAAQAKEAGLDPAVIASAFAKMDWQQS